MTSVGKYLNFSVEGATAIGSILATDELTANLAVDAKVTVTGFFIYQSSNSKYGNILATEIKAEGGQVVEEGEYSTITELYPSAAALMGAEQKCTFTATDLLVTYINGKNIFVSDGEQGFLLYAKDANVSLAVGDIFSDQ